MCVCVCLFVLCVCVCVCVCVFSYKPSKIISLWSMDACVSCECVLDVHHAVPSVKIKSHGACRAADTEFDIRLVLNKSST